MTRPPGPPRRWERFLRRSFHDEATASHVLGDLREEFHEVRRHRGRIAAGIWYRFHAARLAVRYRASGGAPAYASANLRALFGSAVRELRALGRRPGPTLVSSVVLALGVALAAFAFSVRHGVLGRGLGFADEDRLVGIERTRPSEGVQHLWLSPQELADFRDRQRVLASLSAYRSGPVDARHDGAPRRYSAVWFTADAFGTLGLTPALGRAFNEDDVRIGAPKVALVSYGVWRDEFGAGREVLSSTLEIDGTQVSIIGVMPEGFAFPRDTELWLPLRPEPPGTLRGDGPPVLVFGRLLEGETVESARADFLRVSAELAELYPDTDGPLSVDVSPLSELFLPVTLAPFLLALLTAGCALLVIAGANLATVMMARGTARAADMAVRSALGGGRIHVALPFLVEALMIAALGSGLGLGLTTVALQGLDDALGLSRPYFIRFELDGPIASLAIASALVTVLLSVGVSVLRIRRAGSLRSIGTGRGSSQTARRSRGIRGLIAIQASLACALLVVATLTSRSMLSLARHEPAFREEGVLTARLELPPGRYGTPALREAFLRDVLDALETAPGVRSAALASKLPGTSARRARVEIEGTPADGPPLPARTVAASAGYWGVFDVPTVTGRAPSQPWAGGDPTIAVVNESFARRYFGGLDAAGRRFRSVTGRDTAGPWLTVVGVVPDLVMEGFNGLNTGESAGYYTPLSATLPASVSIAVRPVAPGAFDGVGLRTVLTRLDPILPVLEVRDIGDVISDETSFYRTFGAVFVVLGIVASALGVFGLYGVLSFAVASRQREVGVRLALGASRPSVIWSLGRSTGRALLSGLVVGLGIAWLVAGLVSRVLYTVAPHDPVSFGAAPLLLLGAAVLAATGPMARALRADAVEALRAEG